jgi:hypothetical protein
MGKGEILKKEVIFPWDIKKRGNLYTKRDPPRASGWNFDQEWVFYRRGRNGNSKKKLIKNVRAKGWIGAQDDIGR